MLAGVGAPAALAIAERQGEALRARFAARRDNQADMARLREDAARITDVEVLLKDRRTLRLVLESFQLESEIDKRATLRRVLTEDPADRASTVNRLADPRWRALANAFAPSRSTDLPPQALAAMPVADLQKLERNRLAGLTFDQVGALNAEQLAALSPEQIGAISADSIGALDAAEVTALSREQVAALSPAQMRGLFMWQVAAIEPADIPALSQPQLRALTPLQLSAFSPEQMAAFSPEQLGAFTARQVGEFDDTQLAALGDAGRAILRAAPFLPEGEPPASTRAPLADGALLQRVIDGALTNRFERAMGEANPGMREALYFRRIAGGVTSINQLMADRALTEVARVAVGLPSSFNSLSFEQQRDLLTRRLDVAKLKDPQEVARLAQRYVAQLQAPQAAANPLLSLFGGGGESLTAIAGRRVSLSL